jgi:hypothetical protein
LTEAAQENKRLSKLGFLQQLGLAAASGGCSFQCTVMVACLPPSQDWLLD